MTNNCNQLPNNMNQNMQPQQQLGLPTSMPPNFPHPPHHGFMPTPQQYWQQFYNSQQQFSNHPSMQSIPNLMTGGYQNDSNNHNFVNSNAMRQVNNIWSQPNHQLNNEGNGRMNRTMQHGRHFHPNQGKWNNHGYQNHNNGNQRKNNNQQKMSEWPQITDVQEDTCTQESLCFIQKMKEKIDKRDLAENNVFYCDACDRGFKTEQVYTEHVNNHQTCTYKGCSYVAAPKLVELHIKLQHRNGYAKKIWSLESKEDIENWIKARKSNYPTSENITKKKILNNEKKERGEVLETKQFGKMKGRGRFDKSDKNCNWKRKNEDSQDHHNGKKMKSDNAKTNPSTNEKKVSEVKVDDPLSMLIQSATSSITDNHNTENDNDTEKQSVGLTSILTCYGSDIDSSDNDENKQTTRIPTNINNVCTDKIGTDSFDAANQEEKEPNKDTGSGKRKRNRNKKNAHFHNVPKKMKPTLLEMLLAKEIRHERNVILQCVHYIFKKNFLVEDSSKSVINK